MSKITLFASAVFCLAAAGLLESAEPPAANPPRATDASVTTPGRMIIMSLRSTGGEGEKKLEIVDQAEHGKVEIQSRRGRAKYVPEKGYAGMDRFTFRVVDARGVASEPATVEIEVMDTGGMVYARDVRFLPPPRVKETGKDKTRLFKLGYLDVTWYDGWEGHRVDSTGKEDSTAALQKAIDDGYDYQLAVFFPAGTYTVSDTLKAVKKRSRFANFHDNNLVGSRAGARPVIRLAPQSPGFGDPENPKPVLWVWTNREAYNRPFGAPASEFSTENNKQWNSMGFLQSVENLTIDCNGLQGNAGAIGLRFAAAQASDIHDVNVIATGAFAGFYDIPSRSSSGAANIEIDGGRYGLYLSHGASSIIVGATLRNQTEAALYCAQFPPIAMVGFHIVKKSGPVITIQRDMYSRAVGTMSLMDGIVELEEGGVAFDDMADKNFYMRNVYVRGSDEIVKTPEQTFASEGEWKRVAEYAHVDPFEPKNAWSYKSRDSKFPSVSVIDGKISKASLANVESASEPPPKDLVSRHVWKRLPSFEDPDCVVLTDVSDADGSDDKDDWAAIQGAVDQYDKIFVPKGVYWLSQTLTLNAKTTFFGINRPMTRINPSSSWKPTSEVSVIQTVDDPDAETYLGTLQIGFWWGEKEHDWFNLLNWRAGAKSMVMGLTDRFGAMGRRNSHAPETNPHSLWTISGNGGGRWYFWGVDKSGPNEVEGYRHLLIDGTTQPLWMYGCNLEKGHGLAGCEIANARNVRIFSVKVEKSRPIFKVHDSENIGIFSSGAMRRACMYDGKPAAYYWVTGACDNILFANINPQSLRGISGGYTLVEDIDQGKTVIDYPEMVAVYKRGELDDAAMRW